MSRVEAAAADRLPWLSDEPQPRRARRLSGALVGWGAAIVLAVAGTGFWMGTRSVQHEPAAPAGHSPTATVRLPAPRGAEVQVRLPTQPQVPATSQPEVQVAPVREVRIPAPPVAKRTTPTVEKESSTSATPTAAEPVIGTPSKSVAATAPQVWNPRIASGAAGRLVQIGAFGSIRQAKQGWWHMARAYPAMRNLPAVVRPTRNSKGRVFYRFQVGTTSQAHSEILCQRMQAIRFSCAVVDLPWKAKVER